MSNAVGGRHLVDVRGVDDRDVLGDALDSGTATRTSQVATDELAMPMATVPDVDQLERDGVRARHQLVGRDRPASAERLSQTHTPAWRGWTEAHPAPRRVPSPRPRAARALGRAYVASRGGAS